MIISMNTRQKTSAQLCQVAQRLGGYCRSYWRWVPEDGKTIIQDIGVSKVPQSDCPAAPAGSPSDCSARPAADCANQPAADYSLPDTDKTPT